MNAFKSVISTKTDKAKVQFFRFLVFKIRRPLHVSTAYDNSDEICSIRHTPLFVGALCAKANE
jgi:hypothetical protein